jgi:hypothetical protein
VGRHDANANNAEAFLFPCRAVENLDDRILDHVSFCLHCFRLSQEYAFVIDTLYMHFRPKHISPRRPGIDPANTDQSEAPDKLEMRMEEE